MMTWVARRR